MLHLRRPIANTRAGTPPGRPGRACAAGASNARTTTRRITLGAAAIVAVLAVVRGEAAGQAPGTTPPVAPATAADGLQGDVAAATRATGVARGLWGIVVESLDRGDRLVSINPDVLLVPASTAKIVTVAAGAAAVGWDFQYETRLRTTGPIVNGVLQGDLVAVGAGDPTIGGRGGSALAPWVDAVRAAGIRRIEGRIIGDDDAFEEPRPQLGWTWDDLGYQTGAVFGALNLAENRLTATIAPGPRAGAPTVLSVEPHATGRPLGNRSITGPRGSAPLLWPEQRPADPFLTIDGSLPEGAAPARLAVAVGNPTAWFADVLRHELATAGIEITGRAHDIDDAEPKPVDTGGRVIHVHRSPALSTLVQPLLKESINLYAEAVLRLSVPPGTFPTNDAALAGLERTLTAWGVPPGTYQLVDGSGLSRRDVLTAATLVRVLARSATDAPFVSALPIAGTDGSLAQRMRGTAAEGRVRAKTGTMSNIRSLAGYVTTTGGERLAFAIVVNNFEGTGAQATQAIDAIAVRLASLVR